MHDVHSLISVHFFLSLGLGYNLHLKHNIHIFMGYIFSEYWEIIKGKKSKWIFTIYLGE